MAQFGKAQSTASASFGKRVSAAPQSQTSRPRAQPELSTEALAFLATERAMRSNTSFPAPREAPARPSNALPDFVRAATQGSGLAPGKPVWGLRIIAAFIDFFITGVPVIFFLGFGIMGAAASRGTPDALFVGLLMLSLAMALVSVIYAVSMEASPRQATWGKAAVGIIVTDVNGGRPGLGAIILRNTIGRFGSNVIPFYIGYLMGLFRPDRRCLHDLIAGTMVCEKVRHGGYASTFK